MVASGSAPDGPTDVPPTVDPADPLDTTVGLGRRAARGAAVTLGAQGAKILIQVVSVVVLARLLSPRDYGLVAMVATLVGVGELLRDFGLSSAAIQAKSVSRRQRDNLFWINTGIGAALTTIAFFAGSLLLAAIYRRAELIPLTHALAFIFLVNGMTTQFRAGLVRNLRFRVLAVADVVAPGAALVLAIAAALLGWGYWALVVQQLMQAALILVIVVAAAGWLPGLPHRGEPMRDFLRFGWNLLGSQIVGYLANNVDTVTVGVRFGSSALGLYTRAFSLLMMPLNQIRTPLTTVALPVLSRLQAEPARYQDYVRRSQLALGYTLAVALALVIGAAHPITAIFLGQRWISISPLLALFAVAGIFQTLAFVGYWVYTSRGLTADLFRYSLVSMAIKVVCVLAGSTGGILGVAIGYAVAPMLSWPISLWWLSRRTAIPVRGLYEGAGRILAVVGAAAASVAVVTTATATWGAWVQLGLALLAVAGAGALLALLVPPIRRDVLSVVELARMIRRPGHGARRP